MMNMIQILIKLNNKSISISNTNDNKINGYKYNRGNNIYKIHHKTLEFYRVICNYPILEKITIKRNINLYYSRVFNEYNNFDSLYK